MQSSSRSESAMTAKLDHDSFVAFDHAAAGHEGVQCTVSGTFIAKPCTAQEVAFYESSALHPAFQEFLPTYIGTLTSANEQQPLALAAAQQAGAILLPGTEYSSASDTPTATVASQAPAAGATTTPIVTAAPETASLSSPAAAAESSWVPSNGKKLETGISIVLENVAAGFKRPNVLDVKLGARLWADDAPPSKRVKLDAVSKETTSSTLGFRIAGMKVWTGVSGETDEGSRTDPYATKYEGAEGAKGQVIEADGYKRYDKWYGRSLTESNIKDGFRTFLAGAKAGAVDRSQLIARRLAEELKQVQEVLESEESRMYSSSVLIVYEGDPDAMEKALEEEQEPRPAREEENDDEEDENVEFEISEGSFQVVDIPLGQGSVSHQAININLGPEVAELGELDLDEDEEDPPKVHDLRLIDFAHASWTPGQGPDENVLKGIRSLTQILEELALE
ncbi:SAICAR synthase-like protein [Aspergillus japonicus CBS 114.51]|uniref:Kinase n=2 Tax=Aspergillus TaxID=5052 RepID=A0A2V5GYQ9_ASPV1|nr:SAICAR synthase-like protein [Aspergillus japonicus CBS 114.51]PYI14374.1 SAICAR synthase-like protein [Aspergillus violaceofuscus CBS 115571]RAH86495.1 SAICAR synthase-like protein [Aspergillus japonicus CBS 114.51]